MARSIAFAWALGALVLVAGVAPPAAAALPAWLASLGLAAEVAKLFED